LVQLVQHLLAGGAAWSSWCSTSSQEALLGPAGAAYTRSSIVVATDGLHKKSWIMGAALVAKGGRLPACSVTVFGQQSSIRPELTGIALVLEDCLGEEDLNVLTDSFSSMQLYAEGRHFSSLALSAPGLTVACACGQTTG
jgi:hypothetical protein